MNKQCFRVIFSKTLQRLVVVSELAKSEGKSTERNDFSISHVVAQLKPLTFSLFCALGFVAFSDSVLAETLIIQADKSAPKNQQPIVLQTANGLPQVNIQTPNDKGLSHNKYSQFDVAEKGAILNNSRTNTQTQQAGMVQGNPYLTRGEAKVILNEVNSNKPSVMKGYVEVAGKKADVIIANPSGLHCEGCGIINSDRATFTTGKPEIKNGQVDNFKVEAGKVKVSGKGLDNSRVDYTEIIARETEVNAGIWSKKETKVITGKNTVKRSETDKTLQIIHTNQPLAEEAKPQVAIDIGELGGMYSGKIHLIGTEDGVGVRNAGHIGASFDSVVIDASGKIINTQYIGAQKDIVLNAKETVENKGIVYAKQQLNTKAQSLSNQQGTLLADNLIVEAKQVNNQTGKLLANKKITLVADTLQDEGEIISNGDVDVRLKADFQLNNAFQVANNLTFVTEGNFTNQTEQRIGNQFNLTAKQILNPHQKTLSATQTFLNAQQITNRGTLDGSLTVIKSDTLDNLGTGRIYGDDLAIQADRLNNDKEGEHSATIAARKRLDLGVGTLRNRDHSLIFSAGDLFVGGKLNNHFIAEGNAKLIENQSATIEVLGNGAIFADRLRNEDRYLTLGIKYDYDKYEVYTPLNTSAKYYGNAGKNGQGWMDWNNDSRRDFNAYFRFNDRTKGSVASRDWVQHIYTQETATTTIEKQDPAKILIGGNLTLNGGTFINDKSRIAVGNTLWIGSQAFNQNPNGNSLNNQGVTLENIDLIGDINRIDRGVRMQINAIRKRHGIGRRVWVHDPVSENYDPIVHPTAHFNFQLELNPIGKNVEKTGTQAEAFTQADQVNLSNMSSLYQINPDAERGYLIETDPRFTDGKQWLSSDYMYQQLRHNFDNVHKRLGDGFFEQRLINEQINQLTGRRYLSGYQNDMAQYQALMNSGLKYAKQFNLVLGVALTPQQMAELTTDMVWLVNKEITLADGRKVTALVPQVYLVPRDTHLTAQGALISANKIFAQTDSLQNSGTIAGDEQTVLHANQLENRGTILGDNVDLSAKQTLLNLGGKISAVNSLSLFAGQQLEIASTTSSSELKTEHTDFARTQLDRLASVSVTGAGGTLQLRSDGDITVKAAQISSEGTVDVLAKKGLSIITVHTQNREHYNSNPDNYYRLDQTGEIGSEITGKAGVKLVGLDNAVIRQSEVSSPEGDVFVGSKGKVSIESGKAEETLDSASKMSAKGLFSKTTETLRHHHQTTGSQGSSIDGVNVKVYSEKDDVVIKGSNVVAENALEVEGENVSILAEKNRHYEENDHRKTKSGVMGTGGIGFNAGSKKETTETDNTQESATGSLVGSLQGKTTITARNHYEQKGSSVTSRDNDVDIQAKKVDIAAENLQYESNYTYTMEQKGVTIAVNIPVVQAVQNAINMVKEAQKLGESKNNRINAMAAANSVFEAMRLVDQALGIMKNAQEAQNMAQAANISVSITYGEQKSTQTQTTRGNTGQSSQVQAGGNVSIRAVEDGSNSDITITGSDVMGKKGTLLKADDEVNILAFQQNHQERSENKSSGFNAGVAVSYGSNGLAFGVTAGGNYGKGYGNGDETTWLHSHIGSQTGLTQIESGGTTTVKGGQVRGNRVELSAENLNIESVQDTMSYESKQMNAEGQVTVGYGFSASGSYNQSKMKANSATVTEQSGIFAGDGGFDIHVNQHTDLKGAVVTSTASAEQEGKNHFSTNTLSHQDIQNHSSYSAKGFGLSGGFSVSGGEAPKEIGGAKLQQVGQNHKDGSSKVELGGVAGVASQGNWGVAKGLATAVLGQVRDSSSENGVTTSAIHTSNITIRDSAAQQQRTGKSTEQTIADINRENIHQSVNKVDIDKVKSEFERDLKTATDFVKNVSDVGDEIYHRIEKSDDVLAIKKGLKKDCEHIDCVSQIDIDVDDLRMPTTKEEAEAMKRMYVHGIFNMDDKDRKEGAIQYGGEDFLNNDVLVIKRQYSSVPAELVFTVFERLRAGVDMPSVFGASNASKAQVKVWELLNEYNKANPNEQVDLTHVAHSLGASGTKNAMNWAKAQGMQFDNTYFDGYVAGTSYPITNSTIGSKLTDGLFDQGYSEKGSTLFGAGKISYTAAPGDIVATGVGLPFTPGRWSLGIGNTDTTGNNFPRIPGRILTGDHNVAYYRDERVINFLSKDKDGQFLTRKADGIKEYQRNIWGGLGPKTDTIYFSNGELLKKGESK